MLGQPAGRTYAQDVAGARHRRDRASGAGCLWVDRCGFSCGFKWVSAIVWVDLSWSAPSCCSRMIPKSFLPTGDSSFMFGVMIAQQGTSPDQMQKLPGRRRRRRCAPNPNVDMTVTVSGFAASFWPSNARLPHRVPERRAATAWPSPQTGRGACVDPDGLGRISWRGFGQHDQSRLARISCNRSRCCRSARARRAVTQGDFSLRHLRRRIAKEVYETAGKLMMARSCHGGGRARFSVPLMQGGVSNDMYPTDPATGNWSSRFAIRPSSYGISVTPDRKSAAQRLQPELRLPDQTAHRSISGDPGSAGQGAGATRRI